MAKNTSKTLHVGCDYDEGEANTYRAFEVYKSGQAKVFKKFASGNPVKDWKALVAFLSKRSEIVVLSSSCQHFTFDDPRYGWDKNDNLIKV